MKIELLALRIILAYVASETMPAFSSMLPPDLPSIDQTLSAAGLSSLNKAQSCLAVCHSRMLHDGINWKKEASFSSIKIKDLLQWSVGGTFSTELVVFVPVLETEINFYCLS